MKKHYILCMALACLQFSNAQEQIFTADSFETLTLGVLTPDTTGASSGQNGWYAYRGISADYQVAQIDATHGKSLSIRTGNSYTASQNPHNRYVFKPITTAISSTNNNIAGKLDMYTGNMGSTGILQSAYYTASAGIVGIYFDGATRTVRGLANLTSNGTTGLYSVGLGTQTFATNTWITASYTYNKTTGALTWNVNNVNYAFPTSTATATLSPGLTPVEYDILGLTIVNNTVSHTVAVDNVLMRATNNILATNETIKDVKLAISVFPNPSSDFVSVKSDSKINNVNVYDVTGKKLNVKTTSEGKLDVRQLPVGNYMISIETNDGIFSDKFIKK